MKTIKVYHVSMDTDIDKYDYLTLNNPKKDIKGYEYIRCQEYDIRSFCDIFDFGLNLDEFDSMFEFCRDLIKLYDENGLII